MRLRKPKDASTQEVDEQTDAQETTELVEGAEPEEVVEEEPPPPPNPMDPKGPEYPGGPLTSVEMALMCRLLARYALHSVNQWAVVRFRVNPVQWFMVVSDEPIAGMDMEKLDEYPLVWPLPDNLEKYKPLTKKSLTSIRRVRGGRTEKRDASKDPE